MSTESIRAFAHAGIRVHDLERSRRFYEDLLGFAFVAGPVGPEPAAILTHPSGVTINLILNADAASMTNPLMDVPEKAPGYTHIALVVDDVAAMMEHLTGNAISISEGPVEFPGTRAIFVRDPDGNVLEFDELLEKP